MSYISAFLRCVISEGMFPDEYAVEFSTDSNQKVSLFASKQDFWKIDEAEHTGLLKVFIQESTSKAVFVILPSETLEQGRTVVSVPKQQLESVPA